MHKEVNLIKVIHTSKWQNCTSHDNIKRLNFPKLNLIIYYLSSKNNTR